MLILQSLWKCSRIRPEPISSRPCNHARCPPGRWITAAWSACSVTCGKVRSSITIQQWISVTVVFVIPTVDNWFLIHCLCGSSVLTALGKSYSYVIISINHSRGKWLLISSVPGCDISVLGSIQAHDKLSFPGWAATWEGAVPACLGSPMTGGTGFSYMKKTKRARQKTIKSNSWSERQCLFAGNVILPREHLFLNLKTLQ